MADAVTNGGRKVITHRIKADGTYNEPKYIAWGTGAGTAAVTDTALFTASAEARTAGTSSIVTTTVTEDTYQVVGTITSLSNQTITEVGLFTDAAGGTLVEHSSFSGIALLTGDYIDFTIKVKAS